MVGGGGGWEGGEGAPADQPAARDGQSSCWGHSVVEREKEGGREREEGRERSAVCRPTNCNGCHSSGRGHSVVEREKEREDGEGGR